MFYYPHEDDPNYWWLVKLYEEGLPEDDLSDEDIELENDNE